MSVVPTYHPDSPKSLPSVHPTPGSSPPLFAVSGLGTGRPVVYMPSKNPNEKSESSFQAEFGFINKIAYT